MSTATPPTGNERAPAPGPEAVSPPLLIAVLVTPEELRALSDEVALRGMQLPVGQPRKVLRDVYLKLLAAAKAVHGAHSRSVDAGGPPG